MPGFVSGELRKLLILLALGAAVPAVAASDGPASDPEPASVLLLPPWYIYPDPDLATAEQEQLAAQASDVLESDTRFRVVDQPVLSASDMEQIRGHIRLFVLAAASLESAKTGGKAWLDVRRGADYRIGDGLGFLAERTGARHALLIVGIARRTDATIRVGPVNPNATGRQPGFGDPPAQSSGPINGGSGGSVEITCGLVDLQTGRLVWYDKRNAGIPNLRNQLTTKRRDLIAAMFKEYPRNPGLTFVDRELEKSQP